MFVNSLKGRRLLAPQAAEDANPLLEAMGSANWSTRNESITDLVNMVQAKPRVISAQSVKVGLTITCYIHGSHIILITLLC